MSAARTARRVRCRVRAKDIVFLLQFDGHEVSNRECMCSTHPLNCPIDLHRFRHLQNLREDQRAKDLPHEHNFAAQCGLMGCSCKMAGNANARGCWCGATTAAAVAIVGAA